MRDLRTRGHRGTQGQCAAVLEKAAESWRKKAIESREESSRIRRTVSVATEAEANCLIRAEVWDSCADKVTALIPTDHAAALAEHYQRSREQGWQEAIKLIQTGTKSYQGQWPTALRDALAEVKRQARFEAENLCKRALLRAIKERGTENAAGHYDEYLAALRAEGAKQP